MTRRLLLSYLMLLSVSAACGQSFDVDWRNGDPSLELDLSTDLPLAEMVTVDVRFSGAVAYDVMMEGITAGDDVSASLGFLFESRPVQNLTEIVDVNSFALADPESVGDRSRFTGSLEYSGSIAPDFTGRVQVRPQLTFRRNGEISPSDIVELHWTGVLSIEHDGIFFDQDPSCVGRLGDIDGDGIVGFSDFLILSAEYDDAQFDFPDFGLVSDLTCDGFVNFADFLILSNNFGLRVGAVAAPEPATWNLVMFVALACLRKLRM